MLRFAVLVFVSAPVLTAQLGQATEDLCKPYANVPIPAADKPTAAEAKALAGCDAEDLYYGFHRAPDYAQARRCAYQELDRKDAKALGGPAVLAMIYANGKGIARNLNLALRFACEAGGAPAEIEGRVQHLQQMKAAKSTPKPFDFCDDITSGYMAGFCSDKEEQFKKVKRASKLDALIASWPPAERQAFEPLRAAAEKFFKSRIETEIDLSGTLRDSFMIEEQSRLENAFVNSIARFDRGQTPKFTTADFKKADAQLNATYQRALKGVTPPLGTINPDGIRQTERLWLPYREAWVAFGHIKYPKVAPDAWRTWLTLDRTKQLAGIVQ